MVKDRRNAFAYVIKQHPNKIALTLTATFVASVCEGVGIIAVFPVLQSMLNAGPANEATGNSGFFQNFLTDLQALGGIPAILGFIAVMLLTKAFLNFQALRTVVSIIARMNASYRAQLVKAVINARWLFFINQPSGRFVNALIGEIPRATSLFKSSVDIIAKSLEATILLSLAFLSAPEVSGLAVLSGLGLWLILGRFVKTSREQGRIQVKVLNRLSSSFADALQGIKSIKVMSREKWLEDVIERDSNIIEGAVKKQLMAKYSSSIMREPVIALFLLAGVYMYTFLSQTNFSELLTMALLFYKATTAISEVQQAYQNLGSLEGSFWFVQDLLKEAEQNAEDRPKVQPDFPESFKKLELKGLDFHYRQAEPIIANAEFRLEKGSIAALVGKSGAGKSTIADILCGLIQPSAGHLEVDGGEAAFNELVGFRKKLGYVPQDLFLFHDTIKQNLTLGDSSISDEQIWEVLRNTGSEEFVRNLPEGLYTVVGERGLSLSGGQRQRLSISRAMLRKPEILILDEPTTALDVETESVILNLIDKIKNQAAILAISHQPGLLNIANRVYKLEGGRIAEIHRKIVEA